MAVKTNDASFYCVVAEKSNVEKLGMLSWKNRKKLWEYRKKLWEYRRKLWEYKLPLNTNSPSKIEGVAVGRGSMTGDRIIPPRPSGALPLSQGESLICHPQHDNITQNFVPHFPG